MQKEMNILEIIQALIKRYKILLVIVLLFGFLGGGISFLLNTEEYDSTIILTVGEETKKETDQINQINGEPIYEEVIEYGNSSISEQSKKFYSEILKSEDLLKDIIKKLNLDLEPEELKKDITMEVPENSSSLFITISSSKIEEADLVAEKVAKIFMDEVYDITKTEKIKVLNNANKPSIKNSVDFTKNILISVIIGGIVSFVVIITLEYLDDSIQKSADIEKTLNIPVLGELENSNTLNEDVKMIKTNLEHITNLQDKRIITLTTIDNNINITVKLSEALRKAKKEVLLIDANFREPELNQILDRSNDYGLSNILSEDIKIEEVLNLLKGNNVLTTGSILENPSEKLSNFKMKKLLEKLKLNYDYIIINGHKINVFTDTLELSTLTDGVIILVQQDQTSLNQIEKIKEKLKDFDIELIGVILKKYD